ncbi:chemotaxis protein CheW [Celerinatantimonas sp. YJH-8]|uniref:chemotaxis protein CheW n=1 Tax=Celerinatantimonas sp. YJH-8 TaxID=3228714 RepID=UPI0038C0112F
MSSHQSEQALDDYFVSLLNSHEVTESPSDVMADPSAASNGELLPVVAPERTSLRADDRYQKSEPSVSSTRVKPLEQLLKQTEVQPKPFSEPPVLPQVLPIIPQELPEVEIEVVADEGVEIPASELSQEITETEESAELQIAPEAPEPWHNIETEHSFQALFFEVAGVTYAVPLTDLGGIHQIREITSIFGKPDWFAGIMVQREEKINAIDTAKWVLPHESLEVDYRYLVMLGETDWGLCCERLLGTEWLNQDDVKWRVSSGKRPWLAGLIKQRMCALLHVSELIKLLNQGVNINGN